MTAASSIEEALSVALRDPDLRLRAIAIADASRTADPEELVGAVADQADAIRRNAAIDALTRAGPRSVPTLIKALSHVDPEVVMFAAGILGKTRDPSAIPHLVALLEHEDVNIAQGAIESLARLRATLSVEPLIKALDRDPWLRFAAVHALGEIGDRRAVGALIGLLADEMVGEAVVLALGRIGSSEALSELATLLTQRSNDEALFTVCLSAIGAALEQQPDDRTLQRIASWNGLRSGDASEVHLRLLKVLSNDGQRSWTADAYGVKGAAADVIRALKLRPLYGALIRAGRDPLLSEQLQFCIVSIGAEMGAALAIGVHSPDPHVRLLACRCVGALALAEVVPQVERLLGDREEIVRAAAVQAVARVSREAAIPLLAGLLDDGSEDVREAVATALRQMDAEAMTRGVLATPLATLDARLLALEIMRSNPHAAQRPYLEAGLRDSNPALRQAAVTAIAKQPVGDVVDDVRALLEDPAPEVRREAVIALRQSRTARARELLLQQIARDPETRTHAIRSLGELGDCAVAPLLTAMLDGESPLARIAIIGALAELREPAAEPLLVRALCDSEPEVRRSAVDALARFATPTAVRHGLAAARDSEWQVRAAAVELLSAKEDTASIAVLERLCFDPHPFVAELARRRLNETRPL